MLLLNFLNEEELTREGWNSIRAKETEHFNLLYVLSSGFRTELGIMQTNCLLVLGKVMRVCQELTELLVCLSMLEKVTFVLQHTVFQGLGFVALCQYTPLEAGTRLPQFASCEGGIFT